MKVKSLYLAAAVLASILFHDGRAAAQAVNPESITGMFTELRVDTRELVITTEDGNTVPVKVSMETEFLRVPPGVHDLSKAVAASPHDITAGDRVLVSYTKGMTEAARVMFMPAAVTASRNEAERADWESHGLSGTVSGKTADAITAQLPGDQQSTIVFTPKTIFRRYAPDSVSLTQAAPSAITEVSVGDQIRARGQRSSDGLTLIADEVVFGTFSTRVGTITAIDTNANEITIQEVGTNRPLVVKVDAKSRLKMLPRNLMAGGQPHHVPTTPSGAVDIAKVMNSMPSCGINDLKTGGAVLVSSTKGAAEDKVTAIMLLANAEMFVEMLQQQAQGNSAPMEHFFKSHGLNPAQGMNLPSILE